MNILLHTASLTVPLLRGALKSEQLPALAAQTGFEGIEWLDRLLPSYEPGVWEALGAAQAGLGHGALSLSLEVQASPTRLAEQVDRAKLLIGQAPKLGAKVVRVAIGGAEGSLSRLLLGLESWRSPQSRRRAPLGGLSRRAYAVLARRGQALHGRAHPLPPRAKLEYLQRAAWALQPLARMAADHGLVLGLENHFGLTSHPEDVLAILELAQPEPLGVCLDLDNLCAGQDGQSVMRALSPRAVHVHYKAKRQDHGQEALDLDYDQRLQALTAVGYSGAFAVEYLGPGDGQVQAQSAAQTLRRLWEGQGAAIREASGGKTGK